MQDNPTPSSEAGQRSTLKIRAGIGLVQGIVLYALFQSAVSHNWLAAQGMLFAPLVLLACLLPPLTMVGLGHIRLRHLLLWLGALAPMLVMMGVYDQWRISGINLPELRYDRDLPGLPSFLVLFGAWLFVFIAWPLIMAGEGEQRWRASYSAYFDAGWKFAIQLMFSGLFLGVFWLVLFLGAGLFSLIKLAFFSQIITKSWFAIPASAVALSVGLHLTDIRPGIIHGIRNLLLSLLSWLLPLLALLTAGFLLSLPFTGLQVLWETRHAGSLLLSAAVFIIVLINAAYQDGAGADQNRVLRTSARGAALLLLPLIVIAAYALSLRVEQYGWSPERVTAAVCLMVAGVYAVGYGWAALNKQVWLGQLAGANVLAAWLILAMLAALFSPLADPARISVASQLGRLHAGVVTADKFDFNFLRFEGVRYGHAALVELQDDKRLPSAAHNAVVSALTKTGRWDSDKKKPVLADTIRVRGGKTLPSSFLAQDWLADSDSWRIPRCLKDASEKCDAFLGDFTGGAKLEVLLAVDEGASFTLFQEEKAGKWLVAATYTANRKCLPSLAAVEKGQFKLIMPLVPDMEIAGQRLRPEYMRPPEPCEAG